MTDDPGLASPMRLSPVNSPARQPERAGIPSDGVNGRGNTEMTLTVSAVLRKDGVDYIADVLIVLVTVEVLRLRSDGVIHQRASAH